MATWARWALPATWAMLLLALAAALVFGVTGHWTPVSDQAMITSFSLDTWSSDPPLLGMPTSLSNRTGSPVRHPGPLPFWVMGTPARIMGAPGYGMIVGAVAIQAGAVAVLALVTTRMRRLGDGLAVAVTTAVLMASMTAPALRDPFNPHLAILTCFAAMVAVWAYAAGDDWALVGFVAAGSMAAQAHVTLVPVVALFVLLAVLVTGMELRRRDRGDARRVRLLGRVLPAAVLTGLFCWSGPIIDQLWGTGNLVALLTGSGDVEPAGFGYGLERLVDAVAPRPIWTTLSVGGHLPAPSGGRVVLAMVVLGVIVGVGVWALRTRRRHLLALQVTALTAAVAGVVTSSRIPSDDRALRSPANRYFWWALGAFITMAFVIGAVHAVSAAVSSRVDLAAVVRQRARVACAAAALLAVAWCTVAMGPYGVERQSGSVMYGAVRQHAGAIAQRVPDGGTVRVQARNTSLNNYIFVQSLVGQLRLRGLEVDVDVVDGFGFFAAYRGDHPPSDSADLVVWVQGDPDQPPAPAGYELISRYHPDDPPAAFEGYETGVLLAGGKPVSTVSATEQDVPRLWTPPPPPPPPS